MENIKILQFGEGNFLRAFIDWMMEENSIMVVKPRPGKGLERLLNINCRYQVALQGLLDGKEVNTIEEVKSIAGAINPYEQHAEYLSLAEMPSLRFVVSNTTEAGIVYDDSCQFSDAPALSFPGKLTQLLYHRWQYFKGDNAKGLVILPCELIFHNAKELRLCVDQYVAQWQLEEAFQQWLNEACVFCNTLVDRIVPGGEDYAVVKAEPYHLWVIEGAENLRDELPLRKQDFNIVFTDNEQPYHQRKVTMLNGPHTALSAVGHLAGLETVRDCMLHPQLSLYIDKVMMEELLPTVDLPREEMEAFAADVRDRFLNPFVRHMLTSIMLNNLSKYRTRDLPALKWHIAQSGKLPEALTLALAANLICAEVTDIRACLSDTATWGENLTEIPGLLAAVEQYVAEINANGMLSMLGFMDH